MASTAFRATFLINKGIDEKLVRLEKDYGLNKSDSVRRGVELLHDYLISNVKPRKSKAVELPVEDVPPKPKKRKAKEPIHKNTLAPWEHDEAAEAKERKKAPSNFSSQLCPGEDQRENGPPPVDKLPPMIISPTTIATSTEEKAETAP